MVPSGLAMQKHYDLEHRSQPLLHKKKFLSRLVTYCILALVIILVSLTIGIFGYHHFVGLSWLDSLLNASMILGGMGPVDRIVSDSGKLFASFYALFAGLVLLISVGVILAPIIHRALHKFHLDIE